MFFDTPEDASARVAFGPALKHRIVFQFKLAADYHQERQQKD